VPDLYYSERELLDAVRRGETLTRTDLSAVLDRLVRLRAEAERLTEENGRLHTRTSEAVAAQNVAQNEAARLRDQVAEAVIDHEMHAEVERLRELSMLDASTIHALTAELKRLRDMIAAVVTTEGDDHYNAIAALRREIDPPPSSRKER
jgi:regulator of replication initiation timing